MKKIKSFKGINAYDVPWIRGAICLPGLGIFINSKSYPHWFVDYVLIHEYGHYLDYKYSRDLRPFRLLQFYIRIGIPSVINAATGLGGEHRTYWTEIRANRWARNHFEEKLPYDYGKFFPD